MSKWVLGLGLAAMLPLVPAYGADVVVGFDSGPQIGAALPSSASHAAGVSVGGLISVPLARTAGGSGIITNFYVRSAGGYASAYVVRVWQKLPASTTCTDNANFVGSGGDDQALVTAPFAATPVAPTSTQGDSSTYAALSGLTWDYNKAGQTNNTLYVCLVATATDTADENAQVTVMLSGPQN